MNEPTFGIYIPSYKRAKTCNAHVFLEYGTYVVRQSEYDEYVEALKDYEHIKVIGVEDDLICGLTEVNQWLIDNAEEDVIAILDDDIHHFYYRMFETISLDDAEVVTSELERIGQIMFDLGIGFGATDATIRPWNYDCEFASLGKPQNIQGEMRERVGIQLRPRPRSSGIAHQPHYPETEVFLLEGLD